MTSAISCPLWLLVYEYQIVECAFTSPVRTECGMFLMWCMQYCMSVSAVLYSVYVGLQYAEIFLTFTAGSVCLCGVCSYVVVLVCL